MIAAEDSTPLASLTLGPSMRFSTPAIVRKDRIRNECLICAGIQEKAELWYWKAEVKADGSFSKEPVKQIRKVSLCGPS